MKPINNILWWTIAASSFIFLVSCYKPSTSSPALVVVDKSPDIAAKAKQIRANTAIKLANGLNATLWASDSLAPDPVAMAIDDKGAVYLTRTNRQKNSEFDIRGHKDWMTASISLQTVEDRRKFLHETFAPEKSEQNAWLKDLNEDGSHDWRDLTVEKEEVWKLEDTNKDGFADKSTRVFEGFNEEITDVAGALLVRKNDAFIGVGPDFWRLTDKNKDGIWDEKKSISHGYAVHIGFGGHGMSGAIEGPDGKIYWQIGDIGANITSVEGKKFEFPNSGVIVRSNPDGTDFEVFASGLRNTHNFVFNEYGDLISSDNDGDHPGESERLVHIVEGSDAGWRSNWQYGKYTDPRNNSYKVWMDEKLFKPRWEGQAAYIIPPIMNFHNGPTGMIYNPGTALGKDWLKKYFLVEFVGMPSHSKIWSFGLKPKGASFELDGEQSIISGILPTGIRFGIDGAMYVADWINGWDTKNYGRVWRLDVDADKADLAEKRQETQKLMQLDYPKIPLDELSNLLANEDARIRLKAQLELAARGQNGVLIFQRNLNSTNQLARIHSVWGIGQIASKSKNYTVFLLPLLKDTDAEMVAQAAKVIGDIRYKEAAQNLIPLLESTNYRVQFYAAQALGRIAEPLAVQPLLKLIEKNNDQEVYIRHAAVLALSRIGNVEAMVALKNNASKALRLAAVLVLRRLKSPEIRQFLQDSDEFIVTEVARAINDDLSISGALPDLAQTLSEKRFTSEPLLRRAINACLRVGTEKEINLLIDFAQRNEVSNILRAEALATLGTWANPSVLDRVDGRFRGNIQRDASLVKEKVKAVVPAFLQSTDTEMLVSVIKTLKELQISDFNESLVNVYKTSEKSKIRAEVLATLSSLNYDKIEEIVALGMNDKEKLVRTTAIANLNKLNTNAETLPNITKPIFEKGSVQEQQQLVKVLSTMPIDNTRAVLQNLVADLLNQKLTASLKLDVIESIEATKDEALVKSLEAIRPNGDSETDKFKDALFGGDRAEGKNIFLYNSTAQCIRCHSAESEGGAVGPNLKKIGASLTREQLLQAMIEPSAKLALGYGTVMLTIDDGQEVTGILSVENEHELIIKTSEAEPLKVPISRIKKRENMPSGMPPMGSLLSKREIRNLVEYLSSLR